MEVCEIAGKVQADDQAVRTSGRPHHANLMIWDADHAFFGAETPRLRCLASFRIPDLDGLIGGRGDERSGVLGPRDSKNAAFVLIRAHLRLDFPRLAVVEPYPSVCADTDQERSIRTKGQAVDRPVVLLSKARVELERGSMVEDNVAIVAPRRGPQRPLLPYRDGVDLRAVPGNLSYSVAAVGRDAVPEALLAIAHGNETLAVAVPGQVLDRPAHDGVFAFGGTFACAIPDPHRADGVSRRDIVARGREAGDRSEGGVAGVLRTCGRVIDRT